MGPRFSVSESQNPKPLTVKVIDEVEGHCFHRFPPTKGEGKVNRSRWRKPQKTMPIVYLTSETKHLTTPREQRSYLSRRGAPRSRNREQERQKNHPPPGRHNFSPVLPPLSAPLAPRRTISASCHSFRRPPSPTSALMELRSGWMAPMSAYLGAFLKVCREFGVLKGNDASPEKSQGEKAMPIATWLNLVEPTCRHLLQSHSPTVAIV